MFDTTVSHYRRQNYVENQNLVYSKLGFSFAKTNEIYMREIQTIFDVLGNVGGLYGLLLPLLGLIVGPFVEHQFWIKFVKMAFIQREMIEDDTIKHKVIQLTFFQNLSIFCKRNFDCCGCIDNETQQLFDEGEERLEQELDLL